MISSIGIKELFTRESLIFNVLVLSIFLIPIKVISGEFLLQNPSLTASSINSVYFINSKKGWLGTRTMLFNTRDGGETWVMQNIPKDGFIRSIHFIDTLNGWAVGGIAKNPYSIKTNNGGKTWKEVKIPKANDLFSKVYFIDSQNGWILHNSGAASNLGTIIA